MLFYIKTLIFSYSIIFIDILFLLKHCVIIQEKDNTTHKIILSKDLKLLYYIFLISIIWILSVVPILNLIVSILLSIITIVFIETEYLELTIRK
ncbi:hypothetical protein Clopa_1349 [Clostridium pasteurianum BC1]|uniref:Uncharacterized protein n=1 Tax=Clostridium pasteurianum BC1 TaxID=86416 RepID=R4JZR7_CLOPA|nr:hypothetical protein Clopa_1349 [Clostridium pasteurianum BC1]